VVVMMVTTTVLVAVTWASFADEMELVSVLVSLSVGRYGPV